MASTDLGKVASANSGKSSGTALTLTNTSGAIIPAGTTLILSLVTDNPASTTTPTLAYSSYTAGGSWATNKVTSVGVTTSAGSGIHHFSSWVKTTSAIAVGATIVVATLSASAVARAAVISGYRNIGTVKTSGSVTQASGTSGTSALGLSGIAVGDLLVEIRAQELATLDVDSNTTNGTWDTADTSATSGSSSVTNVVTGIRDKDSTGTSLWQSTSNNISGDASIHGYIFARVIIPPVANAGGDQSVVYGDTVTLDATASTDEIGISSYLWESMGSGSNIMTDDFNRADGALVGASPAWAAVGTGPPTIVDNKVTGALAVTPGIRHSTLATQQDQFSEVTWLGGTFNGPALQMPTFANGDAASLGAWYVLRWASATTVHVGVKANGATTLTIYATYTKTLVAGDVMRLEYRGGVLYSYVNGTLLGQTTPITVLTSARGVGLSEFQASQNGSPALDTWTGGDLTPAAITISNATSSVATFTAPSTTGVYTFRLTVTDTDGQKSTDLVEITVDPPPLSAPPTANAGTDQSVNSGDIVNLTGAGSTDDVGISSYSWVQTAGPTGVIALRAIGAATTYTARTNTTINAPAGIQDGDVLIASLFVAVSGTVTLPTPPAGWSLVGTPTNVTLSGFNGRLCIYQKVASGEGASWTWTHAAYSSQGVVIAYSGVDTTTPLDVAPVTNTGTGTTSTWLTTTPVTNGAEILLIEHDWASNANNTTPPAGYTEELDGTTLYLADQLQTTAAATGSQTHTNNNVAGDPWATYTLALRPSSSGISLTGATINKTVAAGADDFRWEDNDSFLSATGTVLRVGDGTSANYNEHAGWRFTSVAAPQGASVSSAALSVRSQGVTGTIPPVRIYGVLATNPAAPTTYAQANGLALTTAFVDWTPSAWVTGTVYASPDLSSVIEEIIGQVGWVSGNALILVMRDPSGGAFGTAHELMMDAFETAGGTPGSLSILVDGASTSTPSFTAPDVIVPTNYTFQLTVTDADSQTDTDTVIITVNPVSAGPALFEGWGVPI